MTLALISGGLVAGLAAAPTATALPQSSHVAVIPTDYGQADNGGTLPTSPHVDLGGGDWTGWKDAGFAPTFTDVSLASIKDDASDPLAAYDTAVIYQVCDIGTYLADSTFKGRLVNFVANGGKLIVWDSECESTDYSNFIFPFQTSNPGAAGAQGTLTISENSSLGSSDTASPYYLNASEIATDTDAVGDANVFTTYDGNWCSSKRAINTLGVNGPVNTYATYGNGLVLYLGLDADVLYDGMKIDNPTTSGTGSQNLGYLWELMLRQQWNPVQGLPCSQSASGITLSPSTATNTVGTSHTVTATVVDSDQNPISGVVVTFRIQQGPNSPRTATATTDANGKATFTYTGTTVGVDRIQAEATFAVQADSTPVLRTSNVVTKEWVASSVAGPKATARPDAWIRMHGSSYIGNNIYNKTAVRQTVRSAANRGDVQNFWVRVYNDGNAKGTFIAKAVNSTKNVRVRYFSGGKDVTAALKSTKGLSFTRAPGHYKLFRVQVTVGRHATIGASTFAKVIASWTGGGLVRKDAVKAVVSVTLTPTTLPQTGARPGRS